jgi:hypothetical protein
MDLQSGAARAITPEGSGGYIVTADGKFVLAAVNHQYGLYPVAGGDPQKLNFTLSADESPVRFLADGKSLLVRSVSGVPVVVTKVDLATGARQPWKQITPADPAGVQRIPSLQFSADGKSYTYSLGRQLSDLYVVDGLK